MRGMECRGSGRNRPRCRRRGGEEDSWTIPVGVGATADAVLSLAVLSPAPLLLLEVLFFRLAKDMLEDRILLPQFEGLLPSHLLLSAPSGFLFAHSTLFLGLKALVDLLLLLLELGLSSSLIFFAPPIRLRALPRLVVTLRLYTLQLRFLLPKKHRILELVHEIVVVGMNIFRSASAGLLFTLFGGLCLTTLLGFSFGS